MAAVLGHEIAHVVAHHPGERMSNSILTIGAVFLISAMFDISGQLPSLALNLVYGLPNSRTQEVSIVSLAPSLPCEEDSRVFDSDGLLSHAVYRLKQTISD